MKAPPTPFVLLTGWHVPCLLLIGVFFIASSSKGQDVPSAEVTQESKGPPNESHASSDSRWELQSWQVAGLLNLLNGTEEAGWGVAISLANALLSDNANVDALVRDVAELAQYGAFLPPKSLEQEVQTAKDVPTREEKRSKFRTDLFSFLAKCGGDGLIRLVEMAAPIRKSDSGATVQNPLELRRDALLAISRLGDATGGQEGKVFLLNLMVDPRQEVRLAASKVVPLAIEYLKKEHDEDLQISVRKVLTMAGVLAVPHLGAVLEEGPVEGWQENAMNDAVMALHEISLPGSSARMEIFGVRRHLGYPPEKSWDHVRNVVSLGDPNEVLPLPDALAKSDHGEDETYSLSDELKTALKKLSPVVAGKLQSLATKNGSGEVIIYKGLPNDTTFTIKLQYAVCDILALIDSEMATEVLCEIGAQGVIEDLIIPSWPKTLDLQKALPILIKRLSSASSEGECNRAIWALARILESRNLAWQTIFAAEAPSMLPNLKLRLERFKKEPPVSESDHATQLAQQFSTSNFSTSLRDVLIVTAALGKRAGPVQKKLLEICQASEGNPALQNPAEQCLIAIGDDAVPMLADLIVKGAGRDLTTKIFHVIRDMNPRSAETALWLISQMRPDDQGSVRTRGALEALVNCRDSALVTLLSFIATNRESDPIRAKLVLEALATSEAHQAFQDCADLVWKTAHPYLHLQTEQAGDEEELRLASSLVQSLGSSLPKSGVAELVKIALEDAAPKLRKRALGVLVKDIPDASHSIVDIHGELQNLKAAHESSVYLSALALPKASLHRPSSPFLLDAATTRRVALSLESPEAGMCARSILATTSLDITVFLELLVSRAVPTELALDVLRDQGADAAPALEGLIHYLSSLKDAEMKKDVALTILSITDAIRARKGGLWENKEWQAQSAAFLSWIEHSLVPRVLEAFPESSPLPDALFVRLVALEQHASAATPRLRSKLRSALQSPDHLISMAALNMLQVLKLDGSDLAPDVITLIEKNFPDGPLLDRACEILPGLHPDLNTVKQRLSRFAATADSKEGLSSGMPAMTVFTMLQELGLGPVKPVRDMLDRSSSGENIEFEMFLGLDPDELVTDPVIVEALLRYPLLALESNFDDAALLLAKSRPLADDKSTLLLYDQVALVTSIMGEEVQPLKTVEALLNFWAADDSALDALLPFANPKYYVPEPERMSRKDLEAILKAIDELNDGKVEAYFPAQHRALRLRLQDTAVSALLKLGEKDLELLQRGNDIIRKGTKVQELYQRIQDILHQSFWYRYRWWVRGALAAILLYATFIISLYGLNAGTLVAMGPFACGLASTPRALDAWLERRIPQIRPRFLKFGVVVERRIYVDRPIKRGTDTISGVGAVLDQLKGFLVTPGSTVAQVIGVGGTGKSALAVQLGRAWLNDPELPQADRMQRWPACPLLIQALATDGNVSASLRNLLQSLLVDQRVPEWLFRALLKRGRLVPIFDAVTEMSNASRQAIVSWLASEEAPALTLFTNRTPLSVPGRDEIFFEPVLIQRNDIPFFVQQYLEQLRKELNRKQAAEKLTLTTGSEFETNLHAKPRGLSAEEQEQVGAAVRELLDSSPGQRDLTPLFLRMACQMEVQRIREKNRAGEEDARTFAGLVRDYVIWPLGQDAASREDARTKYLSLLEALGRTMLRQDFRPGNVEEEQAVEIVVKVNGLEREESRELLATFMKAGILRRISADSARLGFLHDTVTEFMAARHLARACDMTPDAWTDLFEQIETATGGVPSSIQGLLTSLAEVVASDLRTGAAGETKPWVEARLLWLLNKRRFLIIHPEGEPVPAAWSSALAGLTEAKMLSEVEQRSFAELDCNFKEYWAVLVTGPGLAEQDWGRMALAFAPFRRIYWAGAGKVPQALMNQVAAPSALCAALEDSWREPPRVLPKDGEVPNADQETLNLLRRKRAFFERELVLMIEPTAKFAASIRLEEMENQIATLKTRMRA